MFDKSKIINYKKKNNTIILPIYYPPPCTENKGNLHLLAMTLSDIEKNQVKSWFFSRFIQTAGIYNKKKVQTHDLIYFVSSSECMSRNNYLLSFFPMTLELFNSMKITKSNFSDFLIDHLLKKYYIRMYCDSSKISSIRTYSQTITPILIFGYEDNSFICIDFVKDHSLSIIKIDSDSIVEAFFSKNLVKYINNQQRHVNYKRGGPISNIAISFFKKNIKIMREELKFPCFYIKERLKKYVESEIISTDYLLYEPYADKVYPFKDMKWGVSTIDNLIFYVSEVRQNGNINLNLFPFHFLMEHKKIMYYRFIFLQEMNYLKSELSTIEKYGLLSDKANIVQKLSIKYNLTKKIRILDKIINLLCKIKDNETELIKLVINNI